MMGLWVLMMILVLTSTVLTALGWMNRLLGWVVLGSVSLLGMLALMGWTPTWLSSALINDSPLMHAGHWLLLAHMLFYLAFSAGVLLTRPGPIGEHVILVLLAYIGMMIMMSTTHLMLLFVGIELMSLCLYALVALGERPITGLEASLKYLVTGSMASLMLLMGVLFVYLGSGGLDAALIMQQFNPALSSISATTASALGIVFVLSGLAFKLGLFPFHWWVPDVYEGSTPLVTTLIASAPKFAVVVFLVQWIDAMSGLPETWMTPLAFMGISSVLVGNGMAMIQTKVPRLLGYSSIAHMGFVLLAIWVGGQVGWAAAVYYIVVYVYLATLMVGQWALLEKDFQPVMWLKDLAHWRGNLVSSMVLLALLFFTLSGLPPLMGFFPKLLVFQSVLQSGLPGALVMTVAMVVITVLGVYYAISVVRQLFFGRQDGPGVTLVSNASQYLLMIATSVMMVVTVYPQALLSWIEGLI